MRSNALVVDQPTHRIHDGSRELDDVPEPGRVVVKVWYCGLCHTDLHEIDNDWSQDGSFYPFIPGHEVIGEVVAIGAKVTTAQAGDVVGIGWQSNCCGQCYACGHGWRNLCRAPEATYAHQNGGFQQYVTCHEAFAIPIPGELQKPETAPLLCGGITVFNPLLEHDVATTDNALVIGMGGLGHLALQFLAQRGNNVAMLTRSPSKLADAQLMGATGFYQSLAQVPPQEFEFIMLTAPANFDLSEILAKLTPHGTVCIVGAVPDKLSFSALELWESEPTICGGGIGDPKNIALMLDFAANHGVEAKTELYAPEQAQDAIQRLRDGAVRYRAVVDFRSVRH